MVKYIAETSEEFSRLEGLTKKFLQEVIIEGSDLQVEEGIFENIDICPEFGKINRIYSLELEGKSKIVKLLQASPEFVIVELDGQKYNIFYKSK